MSLEGDTSGSGRPISLGRAFRWGFIVGLVVLILAVVFALVSALGEELLSYLAPGSLLLRPFGDSMADWPGWLTIGLTAIANGLIYGVLGVAVGAVLNLARR